MSGESKYHIKALERGLDLLNAFSLSDSKLGLSDIASRVDLPKSTVFRLLSILESRGYVERLPEADLYQIGIRAFEIGSIYIQTTTVEAETEPFLWRLVKECHQTAHFGVLDRGEVVHIAAAAPDRPIRFYPTIGGRGNAHCTGLGKVLLADLSTPDLNELIAEHGLPHRTEHTITTVDRLQNDLAQIRAQGYACDDEEYEIGLKCVAAPVRDAKNRTVGALSISGPAVEFGEENMRRYIDSVVRTAYEISNRLGNKIRRGEPSQLQPDVSTTVAAAAE